MGSWRTKLGLVSTLALLLLPAAGGVAKADETGSDELPRNALQQFEGPVRRTYCADESVLRDTTIVDGSVRKWQVRASEGRDQLAQRIANAMRSGDLFDKYSELLEVNPTYFASTRQSSRRPVSLYVLSRSVAERATSGGPLPGGNAIANTIPVCGSPATRFVSIFFADIPSFEVPHVVAHELGHIFQLAISNRYRTGPENGRTTTRPVTAWMGNWFTEAMAEYLAVVYGGGRYYSIWDHAVFDGMHGPPLDLDQAHGYQAWRLLQHMESFFDSRSGRSDTNSLSTPVDPAFGKFLRRAIGALAKEEFQQQRTLDQPPSANGSPETTSVVASSLKRSFADGDFNAQGLAGIPYLTDYSVGFSEPSPRLIGKAKEPFVSAALTFFAFHTVDRPVFGPALDSSIPLNTMPTAVPINTRDDNVVTISGSGTFTLRAQKRLSFDVLRFRVPDDAHKVTIRIDTSGTNSNTRVFYQHYGLEDLVPFAPDQGNPNSSADQAYFGSGNVSAKDTVPIGTHDAACVARLATDPYERCHPDTTICDVVRVSNPDGSHRHEPAYDEKGMPYRGTVSAIVLANGNYTEQINNPQPQATVTITTNSDEHACDPPEPPAPPAGS